MNEKMVRTRQFAEELALSVPVRPMRVVFNEKYMPFDAWLTDLKGVGNSQKALDQGAGKDLISDAPGTKARVIYFDGAGATVAGFSPEGELAGFGQALWERDPRGRDGESGFMKFRTAYVVATKHEGNKIASTMMSLLENHLAANNRGIGAAFLYNVEAETVPQQAAARRLIEKVGGVPSGDNVNFLRILLKPKYYRHEQRGFAKLPSDQIMYRAIYSRAG